MNYEKPTVGLIASAVETIKSEVKETDQIVDSKFELSTPSAYQADE